MAIEMGHPSLRRPEDVQARCAVLYRAHPGRIHNSLSMVFAGNSAQNQRITYMGVSPK